MRTLARYTVLQLPGWCVAGLVLWLCVRLGGLELRLAGLFFALWVAKDYAMYPFVRVGYERRSARAGERVLGERGVAQQELAPEGYVRVGSELWQARVAPGRGSLAAGSEVRVVAMDRMTLVVEPADGGDGDSS